MSKILLIFPSFGTDESFYKKLIKTTPNGWKVIFLHYKGVTQSGNFNDFEKKVLDFLEKNNFETINLLGYSLGGALARSRKTVFG